MSAATQYEAIRHALSEQGSVQSPAELHGTLCGMLCIDDNADPESALDDDDLNLAESMSALREITLQGLFDPQMGFSLLLPDDDDVPLETRVGALARWCAGFSYGLSSQGEFDLDALSGEVREVITDITELSKAALTAEDDRAEKAEADYAELVEYVRVGVQLVFLELRPDRGNKDHSERLH